MIEKKHAYEVKMRALNAISELSMILVNGHGECTPEEYEEIKKGVGISIGEIQVRVLDVIYARFPELDDLNI